MMRLVAVWLVHDALMWHYSTRFLYEFLCEFCSLAEMSEICDKTIFEAFDRNSAEDDVMLW